MKHTAIIIGLLLILFGLEVEAHITLTWDMPLHRCFIKNNEVDCSKEGRILLPEEINSILLYKDGKLMAILADPLIETFYLHEPGCYKLKYFSKEGGYSHMSEEGCFERSR